MSLEPFSLRMESFMFEDLSKKVESCLASFSSFLSLVFSWGSSSFSSQIKISSSISSFLFYSLFSYAIITELVSSIFSFLRKLFPKKLSIFLKNKLSVLVSCIISLLFFLIIRLGAVTLSSFYFFSSFRVPLILEKVSKILGCSLES